MFGDDDTTPAAPVVKPKVEVKKKEKPAAKSIVVFDVKVYEETTDLNKLFEKIKEITIDGLVWNGEPKIVPVAFGMNKLQVGCVVEDAKVSLEDVFEKLKIGRKSNPLTLSASKNSDYSRNNIFIIHKV